MPEVKEFKYVGSTIQGHGDCGEEVKNRMVELEERNDRNTMRQEGTSKIHDMIMLLYATVVCLRSGRSSYYERVIGTLSSHVLVASSNY